MGEDRGSREEPEGERGQGQGWGGQGGGEEDGGDRQAAGRGPQTPNHRSARSPRPTPEGPNRDNPIAGPRTRTTRSEPSTPALAGASGRHQEPGSRPASMCPAQPPSKSGGESPRGGGRHHGDGKANRSNESDRTGRGTAHHLGGSSCIR